MGHLSWTWVGMIISNDEVGLQGGQGIKKGIEENGGCVAFMEQINLRFPKILYYLKKINFKTHTGDNIFFDVNGDVPAVYDILNVQILEDEEFQLVKVGMLDPNAKGGISINTGAILWSNGSSQVQEVREAIQSLARVKALESGGLLMTFYFFFVDILATPLTKLRNATKESGIHSLQFAQDPSYMTAALASELNTSEPLGIITVPNIRRLARILHTPFHEYPKAAILAVHIKKAFDSIH
ncbi:hypothetical protein NDU88_009331 [Pleurodeles waltl]|uniref:Uncharacterized protein n=1 Tax=Pleurodeles waltl TaxID=8319 RepID=A0AAV7P245_PLEWA|nr:hypothetical protein NDU88_009331 [Pleurodeles waltl]